MRERKRFRPKFAFFDARAIEKTLEEKAAQGWMAEKAGNWFWTYHRIEPVKRRFAVVYDPRASQFDPRPTESQLERDDFCAADGWSIALRWDSMQIYYTDDPKAVPVETEPFTEADSMIRTMKKKAIAPRLVMFALVLMQLWMQGKSFLRDPAEFLSSLSSLLMSVLWLTLLFEESYGLWNGFLWCRRARKAAERQEFYPFHPRSGVLILLLILDTPLLLWLYFGSELPRLNMVLIGAGILGMILLGRFLQSRLKKKGASRNVNRAVTLGTVGLGTSAVLILVTALMLSGVLPSGTEGGSVGSYEYRGETFEIYDDDLPLSLDDFAPVTFPDTKRSRMKKSPFLTYTEYSHRPLFTAENYRDLPELSYTVADTGFGFVERILRRDMLTLKEDDVRIFGYSLRLLDEPEDFPAREVWQYYYGEEPSQRYLLFYDGGRLACLTFFHEMREAEQALAAAAEKLKP